MLNLDKIHWEIFILKICRYIRTLVYPLPFNSSPSPFNSSTHHPLLPPLPFNTFPSLFTTIDCSLTPPYRPSTYSHRHLLSLRHHVTLHRRHLTPSHCPLRLLLHFLTQASHFKASSFPSNASFSPPFNAASSLFNVPSLHFKAYP